MPSRKKKPQHDPDFPEELARQLGKPLQKALIDFDIHQPVKQIIGADPIDLTNIPTESVRSMLTGDAVITIVAHQGDGQNVADFLAERPDFLTVALGYAQHYLPQGVHDFALNALSTEHIANAERATGKTLPNDDDP